MFKILNDSAPLYLSSLFSKPALGSRRQTLLLPLPRIDLYKSSLSFYGPTVWNSLPTECSLSTKISSFKSGVNKYLKAAIL